MARSLTSRVRFLSKNSKSHQPPLRHILLQFQLWTASYMMGPFEGMFVAVVVLGAMLVTVKILVATVGFLVTTVTS
jgi:hypothetical protein